MLDDMDDEGVVLRQRRIQRFLNMADEWRLARDGRIYSITEFIAYYGHQRGHVEWDAALNRIADAVQPQRFVPDRTPSTGQSTVSTESTVASSTDLVGLRGGSISTGADTS